jgi:DNA-directed RNA polymerase subunit K/omega
VARAREHLAAGADHVCLQLREERSTDPALAAYRELAAGLLEL